MSVSSQISTSEVSDSASEVFESWLLRFGSALEGQDIEGLLSLLADNCHWKDLLSFTWSYPVFIGHDGIREGLEHQLPKVGAANVRLAAGRAAPRFHRRSGKSVLEGYFDFDTKLGKGSGFVRLHVDPEDAFKSKVWSILTSLQELEGFEERINDRRPIGDEFSQYKITENWKEVRDAKARFADRDPEVLIIGGGHCGLILAARLGLMGADALVIEKEATVGDTWRKRYHSLTLHNESIANHMPFIPFPPSFPIWLSKDQLADWLESYARSMECNVWTSTKVVSAVFDESSKKWTVTLEKPDATLKEITCKHVVFASGVSGSIPKIPHLDGIDDFKGEVIHSSQFTTGAKYRGKNVLVVGTGNSGHDVAQDLVVNGAGSVSMLQRSPTCVVSLEPTATAVFRIFREGLSVEDIDLMAASVPYDVLIETYQHMSKRAAKNDAELIAGLNAAGMETWYGSDNTGFHMMYLRGEGGYYINVGCSEMIIDGRVRMVHTRDSEHFVEHGLLMKDGSVNKYDAVIMATGFKNMQENARAIMGDDIADKIGSIWGFDEQFMMKNMYRHTAQENFWIMGGALIDARVFSRYLAILLVAELRGIKLQ
ncbi:MAG: NAD(P)/FAD-dependent oxidoreductase [Gammaproteobacteria bacterium]|nr:NAD(P)/FAD-dependent oxidoreductase [Gammaproteobacteria bacterium]